MKHALYCTMTSRDKTHTKGKSQALQKHTAHTNTNTYISPSTCKSKTLQKNKQKKAVIIFVHRTWDSRGSVELDLFLVFKPLSLTFVQYVFVFFCIGFCIGLYFLSCMHFVPWSRVPGSNPMTSKSPLLVP